MNFELLNKNKSVQPITSRIYSDNTTNLKPNVLVQKKN